MSSNTDPITLLAGPPAYGGSCVSRRGDGKVVLVKGAIPGEKVEARIFSEKKDYASAAAVRIVEPSPDRVAPPCRHFGDCGGCHLQYMNYGRQVAVKEEVLRGTLRRVAGLDVVPSAPLVGKPFGYRRRARFKVWRGSIGFFRERTHYVVDVESCPLMADEVNAALSEARGHLEGTGAKELYVASGTGGTAARLSPGGDVIKPGGGYVELDLDGLRYTLSPGGFFQANWDLNVELVRLLLDSLRPLSGKRVLDLYSGAGNFSLPLAREASEVVAVEENARAAHDGKRNAALNGIENCVFVCSDAGGADIGGKVDVVVADPPRTGLSGGAIEKILQLRPEKVAYVSCDPATLARDLKKLKEAYQVESMRLVDFFPQTYHIEAAGVLKKNLTP